MRLRLMAVLGAGLLMLLTALALAPAAEATPSGGAASAAALRADSAESITGTLKFQGDKGSESIPDVTVSVSQDGKEIGNAKSDAKGAWTVAVPAPGVYQVTLDVSSLPKTVQLRTAGAETLSTVTVRPGAAQPVIFPLVAAGEGTGSAGGGGDSGGGGFDHIISVLVVGLRFGVIIAITAVGLSLIFGTTRLINFAHGELVTIGAVVAFWFGTSPMTFPFILAVVLAVAVTAVIGGGVERWLWRPLRRRRAGLIQMFIISIGLSLLLRHLILLLFGSQREQYAQATIQTPLQFGPVSIIPRDLVIILVSILVLLGVAFMLQRTRMGKAMRAVSDNKDLAEASGIDVDKVVLNVWILGGGLAALGGVFYGLTAAVYWDMGFNLLLLMFAGVILGGLGSAYGAMLGSVVVGIVAQLSTVWFPSELQTAWALLVLIIVLLVRPQGILGRLQRAG